MSLANFNGKEHMRHRAVSLRQHGFLVVHLCHASEAFDSELLQAISYIGGPRATALDYESNY